MFLQQRMLHKCNSLKTGIFCAKRAMLICEKHKPILKVIIIQNIPKSLTSQHREPICKFLQLFLWLFSKFGLICSFNQLELFLWRICLKRLTCYSYSSSAVPFWNSLKLFSTCFAPLNLTLTESSVQCLWDSILRP